MGIHYRTIANSPRLEPGLRVKQVIILEMSEPNSLKWTLRFKNHNVTILLLVSPTQSFDSIKEEILKALKVRNITEINGQSVPENPAEIEFGVPLDRNNLEKGWKKLRPTTEESANGKQKQPLRGRRTAITGPEEAGLKDSQAIAFRFRKPVEGQDEDELGIGFDDPGWDVMIAKYDAEDDE
ncbi:hypothetical protein RJZ56_002707 [Blastomyces dermatitidis]|uniref:Uncharacterized protein n=3 Tax=Blastomyces TaxID=229219 RepID=A0A179UM05_BLAGS|nr:uncharacterized protein BDBG_04667 [Blastomyces gilchristii SLH14081]XP_045274130.1 uncharacterized protein BDCG_01735 [Blastomyces dermatitidis ER-3]EGE84495.2 hypothetical protein BDDG_07440 [Blastomyces dermatitidis ATCC 18188]EQL37085.1 hypothetical protein BDFG_01384 [Blastomyces dermatitidis ATCC 26199]EEQ86615.1 hypothetical protein BDCG_01735 [Blastomyces dermatitidis ER-3]OAT09106.1 hypothetical protein BDBG_04667 [Blastomyces gilchristii SLH14081]